MSALRDVPLLGDGKTATIMLISYFLDFVGIGKTTDKI